MSTAANEVGTRAETRPAETTVFPILYAISFCHMLNDSIQSLIPSIYPILKSSFALSFGEIGFITLTFQLTASILQPIVGIITDRRSQPYSLPLGMGLTLMGLLLLSIASSYALLLVSVALVGMGSSVFHPESSRVARMASGGRFGLAQSLFQVGGNLGSALGPLIAALVILPHGRGSLAWFSVVALIGIIVLSQVGRWYSQRRAATKVSVAKSRPTNGLPKGVVVRSIAVLALLIFSKFFYMASLNSYYTFYLIDTFHLGTREAQLYLFLFLGAVAAGTILGGPLGDKFGRKFVIWLSILGVFPFTMLLPYASLFWTALLSVIIGLILASAFSAILVYAQELVPGRVGMVAGIFFGLAFGMGGIGAAVLGALADRTSIGFVYHLCAYLPLIGLLAIFLPDIERRPKPA